MRFTILPSRKFFGKMEQSVGKPRRRILAWLVLLGMFAAPIAAGAEQSSLPIKADDGSLIENHRVPAEIERRIENLPSIIVAGNPQGSLTLVEFYDVNCPFCRKASSEIDALLHKMHQLRLTLVPFPVLGIASIQATRVELAVAGMASPQTFYQFHRKLDGTRGVVDGPRALATAQAMGLDANKLLAAADADGLADVMKAHVHLGDALDIKATPGFVVSGVAIVGYPGPKALEAILASAARCGAVMCATSDPSAR